MAGSKHGRLGGSGRGDVSPLAAQLQQAWLQTQMPKTQKRSLISAASQGKTSPEVQSPHSPPVPLEEQSAFKSLSSIFPELAALPQEKKPMIFSVFPEGEGPKPRSLSLPAYDSLNSCPSLFDGMLTGAAKKKTTSSPSLQHRSLSASPAMLQSSNSFENLATAAAPVLSTSGHSSLASLADAYSPDYTTGSTPSEGEAGSPIDLQDLDTVDAAVGVEGRTIPFYHYLNNLLDEEPEHNKCMFVECSAYQAMAKELGDLIENDSSLQPDTQSSDKEDLDRWLDEITGGPLPDEVPPDGLEHSYDSFTSDEGCDLFQSFAVGNGGSWANEVEMLPEAAGVQSIGPILDSVCPSSLDDDALHHSNMANGGNGYVSKPTISQQISNGHHIPPVDLNYLLLRCAQAVEQNDFSHASEQIAELRQHSSAYGNGPQRMAHYFMEALVARMSGTGGQLYTALNNNRPSALEMLKAFRLFAETCPFVRMSHYFSNMSIINEIGGAKRVHIVDYGILYGVQWPCFIYYLSMLPEGPPHLRITGIDRPQAGFKPSERIQETGRRLAQVAEQYGVPFEFHAIAEKWEAITPAHLFLRKDEVLAVNCIFRLRHLMDESIMAASPRNLVLKRIQSMNPKIFVQGVVNAGYNAPFFTSRFREAVSHFSALFDALEASMPAEHPDRVVVEQEIFGREILNIVACEGLERVERAEPYKQWQARTLRAGFTQMPISDMVREKCRGLMKFYHRDYGIGEDGTWLLAGWKEKIVHAFSAWQPTPVSP